MAKAPKTGLKAANADLNKDAVAMQEFLSELVRAYQFRDRQRICYYDVSVTQCYAITLLVTGGPVTLNKLAAELYLDKSTASRVIDSLEEKGYVRRTTAPTDARALSLEVTANGKKLHARIERDLVEQMKNLLIDFDPNVRKESVRLMAKLAQAAKVRFTSGQCVRVRSDELGR